MWRHATASVAGTAHIQSNLSCQDRFSVKTITGPKGEFLVCLVSDGAGSASSGGVGAEICCEIAGEFIEQQLVAQSTDAEEFDMNLMLDGIRQSMLDHALASQAELRNYACTLIGSILAENWSIFFQVGDGAIIATSGGVYGVVFWPDYGEYENMTYFVTDDDAQMQLRLCLVRQSFDDIALFTDGLQRLSLSYNDKSPHIPFFEPFFSMLKSAENDRPLNDELTQFLSSSAINARTDDDKTLILATRIC